MDKVLANFNKTIYELLNDLESVFTDMSDLSKQIGEFKTKYAIDKMDNKDYLRYFYNNVYLFSEKIANKDINIFIESKPLDCIDLTFLTVDSDNNKNLEIVWKYLDTLYLLAYQYVKLLGELNESLDDSNAVVENLKSMGFDEEYFKSQGKLLELMMENMKSKTTDTQETGENAKKLPPELEALADKLFNGALGKLAKEIASEVDTSKLNIDQNNPADLLKSLVSGENPELMSVVSSVSSKMKTRIDSGQLNQEMLMSEASKIMEDLEKLKDVTGIDPSSFTNGFNPAMLSNMMNMMNAKKPSNPENLKLLPKNHPKRKKATALAAMAASKKK